MKQTQKPEKLSELMGRFLKRKREDHGELAYGYQEARKASEKKGKSR